MGAILVCIAYLIAPTEAAKLHSTILVGLDISLGLPRMVDKTIKGMIRQFRTHVAEKETRNGWLARSSAIIYNISPGDAHHILATEP